MSIKPILAPKNEQRLGLVLTPQMRQRIEMLSMTSLELSDMVSTEMVANPVLEEVLPNEPAEGLTITDEQMAFGERPIDGAPQPTDPTIEFSLDYPSDSVPIHTSDMPPSIPETQSDEVNREEGGQEPEVNPDPFQEIDFGAEFENYLDPGYKTFEHEDSDQPSFENLLTKKPTLAEHLLWQLNLTRTPEEIRTAAEAIICSLNTNGHLADPLEEIAALGPWPMTVVEKAKRLVQSLDPIGVGSTDVLDCFLIQLELKGLANHLATQLVQHHFNRLQQYRWPDLAKELGVPIDEIAKAVSLIVKLEPYPGRPFAHDEAYPIQPEIFIEKIDDEYYIHFNDDGIPQLRINSHYRRLLESNQASKEEREYVRECFRSAVDLLKNIEHRRQTIYKVCQAIVERQRAFLDGGVEYLKPMMLKDLAELIGIHLSTVSRVVNRKYAHTPQGVIELRRFFTDGMTNDQGEEVSTQLLKLQIKKMIENEDTHHPLTDDEIMHRLAKEGVKLSRRTVAKYRDQMSIPGSRERRVII